MTSTHGGITEFDYGAMIRALNQVHYAGETSFYSAAPLRPCEEWLYQQLPPVARVLDVGCGAGRVTRAITERGGDIVGVDVNQAALEAARTMCGQGSFQQASMTDLPFADHGFDQVWCLRFSFNALPTETERLAGIAQMWRVCAPGGLILIEVFNWHYAGWLGLVRLANLLDQFARTIRWWGQRRAGSPPIPRRDIIYLANKASGAAPGYAHLSTAHEMYRLTDACGIRSHATLTTERNLMSGRLTPPRGWGREYSMWLVLRKPAARP